MSYVLLLGRTQGILLSRKCALSEQYPCSFSDYDVLETWTIKSSAVSALICIEFSFILLEMHKIIKI